MKFINPEAFKYYRQAKTLIEMDGMEGPALMTIRNSLESLIKYHCKMCSIEYDTRESDLSMMIDRLYDSGLITNSTRDLMHHIRQLCNKGAHVDEHVSATDAIDAYNYMGEILRTVSEGFSEDSVRSVSAANNCPMEFPDYYSQNRRYYGKWEHCYTRRSLLVIQEYVELERRANGGDVAACLDIASGFLPKNQEIQWNESKLINMPDHIHRGQHYNQAEAYDARYYYWVMNAVLAAGMSLGTTDFPKKYIATAIWEADLMWFNFITRPKYNFFVSGVTEYYDPNIRQYCYLPEYADQYRMAAEMFGCDPEELIRGFLNYGFYRNVRDIRRAVFEGLYETNIVAPIHNEAARNPLFKLRFIEYCGMAYYNHILKSQPEELHCLSPEDAGAINQDYEMLKDAAPGILSGAAMVRAGDTVTWEMLKPYTAGAFCSKYYQMARNYAEISVRQNGIGVAKSVLESVKKTMRRR